ncbi:MAG: hydroxymethylbilane synthase [Deltaproteobacteria bacterium]|nr:hydroxymethylbilane synthase [Deltaproteobacteria bacterium]
MILKIGTRGSDLAMWQARRVRTVLQTLAGTQCEIIVIKTSGDRDGNSSLHTLQTQGFFTKELERALLDSEIDLAVHSLKDLPTESPTGLTISAILKRADPRDVLLIDREAFDPSASGLPLKRGSLVATGSNRRRSQLLRERPDLKLADLRGNVPTRINKLSNKTFDAMVIAKAALDRLKIDIEKLEHIELRVMDIVEMVPSPGQGAIAVQTIQGTVAHEKASCLDHETTRAAIEAERRLMAKLEGGCQLPLGVNVREKPGGWVMHASLAPRPGPSSMPEQAGPVLRIEGKDLHDLVEQAFERLKVEV